MSRFPGISTNSVARKIVDELITHVESGYDPFCDQDSFPGLDDEAAIDLAIEVIRSQKRTFEKEAASLITSQEMLGTFKERVENAEDSIAWDIAHDTPGFADAFFKSETFQRAFKKALAQRLDGLSAEIGGVDESVSRLTR